MKKYRIIKLESDGNTTFCIQKRLLFFFWEDLDEFGHFINWLSITRYYKTLDEARAAARRFQVKKTIIDKV